MGKRTKRVKTHIDVRTYRGHRTLDTFLPEKNLSRKPIAKDGSCLFRAVAEQVYLAQYYHHKVRLQCVEYIRTHPDDFKAFITMNFDSYLDHLSKELWGGEVELVVVSKLFGRSVVVYNELAAGSVQEQVFPSPEEDEKGITADDLRNPILLAYSDGNHYDSVYTREHMNNLSYCQGIVYRMLYEGVLGDRIPPMCHKRLDSLKEGSSHSGDHPQYLLDRHYGTQSILAMGSHTFHNAALDVHRKEKESSELRDRRVAASIQFQVGDRCQFRLDEGEGGDVIEGEIAELKATTGHHLVSVDGTNEQWQIPCKNFILKQTSGKSKQAPVAAKPKSSVPVPPSHGRGRQSQPPSLTPSDPTKPPSTSSSRGVTQPPTAQQPQKKQPSEQPPPSQASRAGGTQTTQQAPQRTASGVWDGTTLLRGRDEPQGRKSVEQKGGAVINTTKQVNASKQGVTIKIQESGTIAISKTRTKTDDKPQQVPGPPTSADTKQVSVATVSVPHSRQPASSRSAQKPIIVQTIPDQRQQTRKPVKVPPQSTPSPVPPHTHTHSPKPLLPFPATHVPSGTTAPSSNTAAIAKKTNGGNRPGGSLTSDDSSYSSSDESGAVTQGVRKQPSSISGGAGAGAGNNLPLFLADSSSTWEGKQQQPVPPPPSSGVHQKTANKERVRVELKKNIVPVPSDKVKTKDGVVQVDTHSSRSKMAPHTSKKSNQKLTAVTAPNTEIHTVPKDNSSKQRPATHTPQPTVDLHPSQRTQQHQIVESYPVPVEKSPLDGLVDGGRMSPYWDRTNLDGNVSSSQPGDAWPMLGESSTSPSLSNSMLFKAASMVHNHEALVQIPVTSDHSPTTPADLPRLTPQAKDTIGFLASMAAPQGSVLRGPQSPPPPPAVTHTTMNGQRFETAIHQQRYLPVMNSASLPRTMPVESISRETILGVLNSDSAIRPSVVHHQQAFSIPMTYPYQKPASNDGSGATSLLGMPPLRTAHTHTSEFPRSKVPATSAGPIPPGTPMGTLSHPPRVPATHPVTKPPPPPPDKLLINAYTQTKPYGKKEAGSQATIGVQDVQVQATVATGDGSTQTDGVYVAVEKLVPPTVGEEDSEVSKLHFALQYSIQCLALYTHHGGEDVPQGLLEGLELLEREGLEELLKPPPPSETHTVTALNASQQDFLQSFRHDQDVTGGAIPQQLQQVLAASNPSAIDGSRHSPSEREREERDRREHTPLGSVSPQPEQQPQQPSQMTPYPLMHPQMMLPRPMMVMPPPFYPIPPMPYYPMPHFGAHMMPPHPQQSGHMTTATTGPNRQSSGIQHHVRQESNAEESSVRGEEEEESCSDSDDQGEEERDSEATRLVPGFENPLPPSALSLSGSVVEPPSKAGAMSPPPSRTEEQSPTCKDSLGMDTTSKYTLQTSVKSAESTQTPLVAQESNTTKSESQETHSRTNNKPGLPCRPGPTSRKQEGRKSHQSKQNRRSDEHKETKSKSNTTREHKPTTKTKQTSGSKNSSSLKTVSGSKSSAVVTPAPQPSLQHSATSSSTQQQHESTPATEHKKQSSEVPKEAPSPLQTVPSLSSSESSSQQQGYSKSRRDRSRGGGKAYSGPTVSVSVKRTSNPSHAQDGGGGPSKQHPHSSETSNTRSYSSNRKGAKKLAANFSSGEGAKKTGANLSSTGSVKSSQDPTRSALNGRSFLDEPVAPAVPCTSIPRSFRGAFAPPPADHTSLREYPPAQNCSTIEAAAPTDTHSTLSVNCNLPVPCVSDIRAASDTIQQRPYLKFESSPSPSRPSSQEHSSAVAAPELGGCLGGKRELYCASLSLKHLGNTSSVAHGHSPSCSYQGSLRDDMENEIWDSDCGDYLSYASDGGGDTGANGLSVLIGGDTETNGLSMLIGGDAGTNGLSTLIGGDARTNGLSMLIPVSSVSGGEMLTQLVHGQRYVNPNHMRNV